MDDRGGGDGTVDPLLLGCPVSDSVSRRGQSTAAARCRLLAGRQYRAGGLPDALPARSQGIDRFLRLGRLLSPRYSLHDAHGDCRGSFADSRPVARLGVSGARHFGNPSHGVVVCRALCALAFFIK